MSFMVARFAALPEYLPVLPVAVPRLANHIGAIKYFLCYYNLSRAAALVV
jgi:hypothetical protein